MPESRHKYLYERLGDQGFQLLVNALLVAQFPDYRPLPVRQSDRGRDGIRRSGDESLIYQVKWSVSGSEKSSVSWLTNAIKTEDKNIKTLVAEGAKQYVLVTNVASTGGKRGSFDALNRELRSLSKTYGVDMQCMWRETIDSLVDNADDAVKWSHADMLAGWDLISYLIDRRFKADRDSGLRELLHKVAATQWDEDDTVKFSQVDIERERVADLFVDVTAERIRGPLGSKNDRQVEPFVGGAAAYLLRDKTPFTLIRGAPGQGKSTLSQYVCQAHRAAFVQDVDRKEALPRVKTPRFPIRFDLSDYAVWTKGVDVFETSETTPRRTKARSAAQSTIECFLADLLSHASGGLPVTAEDVQTLLQRVPALIVLDGLDEVGSPTIRAKVVRAIDSFTSRARSYHVPPKIVVTTRPSAGELPEPSPDRFEVLMLAPLDTRQRNEYLNKWCLVHGIRAADGRTLRKTFKEKSAEPYIGELSSNPMQLTILLELLHQQGMATPTQRTELYDSYMSLLLAREANKHPQSVKKHRADLMEIIPFLGWYLQSRSEERGLGGRMTSQELDAAMRHFQRTYEKPESVVDELFEATTDRLWALTSKEEGVYEFEVVSLREYFAARFLYKFAGEGDRDFDSAIVFRELLRRPYWLNTARFYSGNAHGKEIYALTAGIREELAENPGKHVHVAIWTLLTDGVFTSRPSEATAIIDLLLSDNGAEHLLGALERKEIRPLPDLPSSLDRNPTWARLIAAIAAKPGDPENRQRVRVLRELMSLRTPFGKWWAEQLTTAVGTATERFWLELGAECEAAAGLTLDPPNIDLTHGGAELLLNTGFAPPTGSALEKALLQAVLDGECPCVTSIRSQPAQIAAAFSPAAFRTTSNVGFAGKEETANRRRTDAIATLRRSGSPFAKAAAARRFKAGERGTTYPWANAATLLFNEAGRCWLASEIAIIGGAAPHRSGHTTKSGQTAFGMNSHPATMLAQGRANAKSTEWWRQQLNQTTDDLSKAEWTLALWAMASGEVLSNIFTEWEATLNALPPLRRSVVQSAALRLGTWGFLAPRSVRTTPRSEDVRALLDARDGAQPVGAPVPEDPQSPRPSARLPAPEGRPARGASAPASAPRSNALLTVAKHDKWFLVDKAPTYQ